MHLITRRRIRDRIATWSITCGGIGIILLVLLIFFYLLSEVLPLFRRAEMALSHQWPAAHQDTRYLAVEEQGQVGARIRNRGVAEFFSLEDGGLIARRVILPDATQLAESGAGLLALADNAGQVVLTRSVYQDDFSTATRRIIPQWEFPYGKSPIPLEINDLRALAVSETETAVLLATADAEGKPQAFAFTASTNLLSGAVTLSGGELPLPKTSASITAITISGDQRWLFALHEDLRTTTVYDLKNWRSPQINTAFTLTANGVKHWRWLLGGQSLLVAEHNGNIAQWSMVRDADGRYVPRQIRTLELASETLQTLLPIQRSKSFIALDDTTLWYANTTAERVSLHHSWSSAPAAIRAAAVSPRSDALLLQTTDGAMQLWRIENRHPQISWSALWYRVWYEGYSEPRFIWQSSAANADFEPKMSLVPLTWGTLKAAFYAMLLGTPLAILGAIYTAYFMAPGLRRKIKPTIEMMEAVPTVVLGFIAGLFLAPFVEAHLPGIFALFLLLPPLLFIAGYATCWLPQSWRIYLLNGRHIWFMMPILVMVCWGIFALSPWIEWELFGGDMRVWLTNTAGIDFDQRNALVIGLAMGFAVIPTIFSIAEDALFSVPRHLTQGSLALGASRWQTLLWVVLPTASPGIFSALMIGFGRAVGETMIVLMATGNTPIMDWNIFTGMRTLAANIAVEIPESEVGSTHFRVLFLTGLVLFIFTFTVNTLAELIRQRLRRKYSTL